MDLTSLGCVAYERTNDRNASAARSLTLESAATACAWRAEAGPFAGPTRHCWKRGFGIGYWGLRTADWGLKIGDQGLGITGCRLGIGDWRFGICAGAAAGWNVHAAQNMAVTCAVRCAAPAAFAIYACVWRSRPPQKECCAALQLP
eukprot:366379-Chlamydomonas_euryale.AAC.9